MRITEQITYVCFTRATSNLGDEEVNAKRRILVLKMALQLVNKAGEKFGILAHAADDTNSTYRSYSRRPPK